MTEGVGQQRQHGAYGCHGVFTGTVYGYQRYVDQGGADAVICVEGVEKRTVEETVLGGDSSGCCIFS